MISRAKDVTKEEEIKDITVQFESPQKNRTQGIDFLITCNSIANTKLAEAERSLLINEEVEKLHSLRKNSPEKVPIVLLDLLEEDQKQDHHDKQTTALDRES